MLPGLWKDRTPYGSVAQRQTAALPHFKPVLTFLSVVLFSYSLQVPEEDWIFNYSLRGIPSPALFPLYPPGFIFPSHLPHTVLRGLDTLTFP